MRYYFPFKVGSKTFSLNKFPLQGLYVFSIVYILIFFHKVVEVWCVSVTVVSVPVYVIVLPIDIVFVVVIFPSRSIKTILLYLRYLIFLFHLNYLIILSRSSTGRCWNRFLNCRIQSGKSLVLFSIFCITKLLLRASL